MGESNFNNIEAIQSHGEIDISVKELGKKINKDLPTDFDNNPLSDVFYSKTISKTANYPLFIMNNISTDMVMQEVSAYVIKEGKGGLDKGETTSKPAVNLYIKAPDGNAYPIGVVKITLDFLKLMDFYLIDYSYYIEKGKKQDVNKSDFIDYEEFNKLIDPSDNVINYSSLREVKNTETKIDLSNYDNILKLLMEEPEEGNKLVPMGVPLNNIDELITVEKVKHLIDKQNEDNEQNRIYMDTDKESNDRDLEEYNNLGEQPDAVIWGDG